MVISGSLPRAALSVVRSLGRRGIPVDGGDSRRLSPPAFSRYVRRWFTYPAGDVVAAHRVIMRHVRAWRPAVLLPVGNQGWDIIFRFYDDYVRETAVIPSAGRALVERLRDKAELAALAAEHGIPMPQTFRPQTTAEAHARRDRLPYPVLLKPRRSEAGVGIVRVDDPAALTAALARRPDLPVIQEYVDGEDFDLTVICAHGRPLAAAAYAVLRQYPPSYGPPAACRTIRDDELVALGGRFLQGLAYHGVANLDFRRDRRDGRLKLLDFNPRLPGSTEVCIRSGVDLPLMLYRLALGETVTPVLRPPAQVEVRWLWVELQHLLATREKRGTLRALRRWRGVHTNAALADPLPLLAEGIVVAHRALRRLRPAVAGMGAPR
jgi:predicted ATP-grasp superfamily ATP-dependent carboligase